MSREEIENIVCQIMIHDGPDRHTDGSDVITDFIVALLNGDAEAYFWKNDYYSKHNIKTNE